MSLRPAFNQLVTVTTMNLRNLPSRVGTSLVAVIGIGGVVAVLVSLLSMGEGFRAALDLSGREDVAMILRGGSPDELSSSIGREEYNAIVIAPGIARDARGPIVSGELYSIVDLPMRSTGTGANVPLRGVGERGPELRDGFRIVAGRMFRPGQNEVIVGQGAYSQFENVDLGREVKWGSQTWRVVGVFEAGGSVSESEVWTDAVVLRGIYRRGNTVQIVRAQLTSPAALQTVRSALEKDPRLSVSVRSEKAFYSDQSRILLALIKYVGTTIAVLMGVGAVFAALNTMYSAVSSRTREIATLARARLRRGAGRDLGAARVGGARIARRRRGWTAGLLWPERLPGDDTEFRQLQPADVRVHRHAATAGDRPLVLAHTRHPGRPVAGNPGRENAGDDRPEGTVADA